MVFGFLTHKNEKIDQKQQWKQFLWKNAKTNKQISNHVINKQTTKQNHKALEVLMHGHVVMHMHEYPFSPICHLRLRWYPYRIRYRSWAFKPSWEAFQAVGECTNPVPNPIRISPQTQVTCGWKRVLMHMHYNMSMHQYFLYFVILFGAFKPSWEAFQAVGEWINHLHHVHHSGITISTF